MPPQPPRETVPIGDQNRQNALNNLETIVGNFDLRSIQVLQQTIHETARQHLPELLVREQTSNTDAGRTTIRNNGKETVIQRNGTDLQSARTSTGVTWTRAGNPPQWTGNDGTPTPQTADSVTVRGEGAQTEIVIEQGNKTTIIRTDGSSITEVRGPNGSRHDEIRDASGNLTMVVHNGQRFAIRNGEGGQRQVLRQVRNQQTGQPEWRVDTRATISPTNEVTFAAPIPNSNPPAQLSLTLRTDGTTVARNGQSNVETTGYGDGTRVYRDVTTPPGTVLGVRDASRNYMRINGDGTLQVLDRNGQQVDSALNGKRASVIAEPPGAVRVQDYPANGRDTVFHLDRTQVVYDSRDAAHGPVEMIDAGGRRFTLAYTPPNSRNRDHLSSVTPLRSDGTADGPAITKPPATALSADAARGLINATLQDGTRVAYNLRDHTKTTTRNNGAEVVVEPFAANYSETFTNGRLSRVSLGGVDLTVTAGADGNITGIQGPHGIRHSVPPARSIEARNGRVTVVNEDSGRQTVTTYNPDRTIETRLPDNVVMRTQLNPQGRPTEINDGRGRVYRFNRNNDGVVQDVKDQNDRVVQVNNRDLTTANADIQVDADGRIRATFRADPRDRVIIDPQRQTTIVDNDTRTTITNAAGRIEIAKDPAGNHNPQRVTIFNAAGERVGEYPIQLPADKNVDWNTLSITESGQIALNIQGAANERLVIDPARRTTTHETPTRSTIRSERGRVEIDRNASGPTAARFYSGNPEVHTFSVACNPDGTVRTVTNERTRVTQPVRQGWRATLEGDAVVFRQGERTVAQRADGAREITTGQPPNQRQEVRDGENWLTRTEQMVTLPPARQGEQPRQVRQATEIDYHRSGDNNRIELVPDPANPTNDSLRRAVPARIRFGNGMTLERIDSSDITNTDGNTRFVLSIPAPEGSPPNTPPREIAFTSVSVDRAGRVHLTAENGQQIMLSATGQEIPVQRPQPQPQPQPFRPAQPFQPQPQPFQPQPQPFQPQPQPFRPVQPQPFQPQPQPFRLDGQPPPWQPVQPGDGQPPQWQPGGPGYERSSWQQPGQRWRNERGTVTNVGGNPITLIQSFDNPQLQQPIQVTDQRTGQVRNLIRDRQICCVDPEGRPICTTTVYRELDQYGRPGRIGGITDSSGQQWLKLGRDGETGADIWVDPRNPNGESVLANVTGVDDSGVIHMQRRGQLGRPTQRAESVVRIPHFQQFQQQRGLMLEGLMLEQDYQRALAQMRRQQPQVRPPMYS